MKIRTFLEAVKKARPPVVKPIGKSNIVDQIHNTKTNISYSLQRSGDKWGIISHSRVSNPSFSSFGKPMHSIERTGMSEEKAKKLWKQYQSDVKKYG